ncbi:NUDIX hydrolase [Lewinella cohaerens]|uniref:NUDIX hydrolase n=1 Tax=Lewinella cohaerens TaxID=70995 RepID=UPI00037D9C55|nr:NUDIX domain-containing protein [Lewinella cohaerens]
MPYTYEYQRPSITVDCIIFGLDESQQLKVLLIRRKLDPYANKWALPGGFVHMEESLENAARRELKEETGVENVFMEQLYTFGSLDRDPRGRVISVAYFALVNLSEHTLRADTDAEDAAWFSINELPELAFDHSTILRVALDRLRAKLRYQPLGFELLPEHFTLSQLQQLYETVLGVPSLNKRNFRTRILKMGVLNEVGRQTNVAHRPAMLFSFDKEKYQELFQNREADLLKRGVDFEI